VIFVLSMLSVFSVSVVSVMFPMVFASRQGRKVSKAVLRKKKRKKYLK
jgi:hypothetical protein